MRYGIDETTSIVGIFPDAESVSIQVLNVELDEIMSISESTMTESSHIPGIFSWDTSNIISPPTVPTSIVVKMTSGTDIVYSKMTIGGVIDVIKDKVHTIENYDDSVLQSKIEIIESNVDTLLNIGKGNWKIEGNQMIFLNIDSTELMRFNLFDENGNPSTEGVYKRELV